MAQKMGCENRKFFFASPNDKGREVAVFPGEIVDSGSYHTVCFDTRSYLSAIDAKATSHFVPGQYRFKGGVDRYFCRSIYRNRAGTYALLQAFLVWLGIQ